MKFKHLGHLRLLTVLLAVLLLLAIMVVYSAIDLSTSNFFFDHAHGFYLANLWFFVFMHNFAFYGARALGFFLLAMIPLTILRRAPVWGIDTRAWAFLFLALLLGPALVANGIFKDHWGRARPREITDFGGTHEFSPPLDPQDWPHRNGSFISGDASFGFYLPVFAYVVPLRRGKVNASRRVFWSGMGLGVLFGLARLAMGAHFLSDILFAAFFMLVVMAGLHATIYGFKTTSIYWRDWLFEKEIKK